MPGDDYKQAAVEFLEMVVDGKIDEAYEKHVNMDGKHHNVYFPAGFPSLKKAMKESHEESPGKKFNIRNVLGDEDFVAVHSHLVLIPEKKEMSVVHMFRFQNGKIIEMWDIGQELPEKLPNRDGPF